MHKFLIGILLLCSSYAFSQIDSTTTSTKKSIFKKVKRKGNLFFYWGWNRAQYSGSDIYFEGEGYDFVLRDVKAYDRPTTMGDGVYINPSTVTIPQYQYRFGYYINDHYNLSWGFNHMKYVMKNDNTVKIDGVIETEDAEGYQGIYNNDDIVLTEDFVTFEHTDGLNYLSFNFERIDAFWVSKNKKQNLNIIEGIGAGMMFPKSNVSLWGDRKDEWHVAGYGLSAHVGLRFDCFRYLFVQLQVDAGFINMPDIITTGKTGAKARQNFFYLEEMLMFGGYIPLVRRHKA